MNRLISHPVRAGTRLVEVIRRVGVGDLSGPYWVAGGAARSVFLGQEVRKSGDIDVFPVDQAAADLVAARIRERTTVAKEERDGADTRTFLTKVEIPHYQTVEAKFQVIGGSWRAAGVEALLSTFDFTVCQFATDGYTLLYPEQAGRDARDGVLRIQPKRTRPMRPSRLIKYLNQGFEPDGPLLSRFLRLDETTVQPTMTARYEY